MFSFTQMKGNDPASYLTTQQATISKTLEQKEMNF